MGALVTGVPTCDLPIFARTPSYGPLAIGSSDMTLLVGISGSLRRHSFNSGLLRVARANIPDGARLNIASISGMPLYKIGRASRRVRVGQSGESSGVPDQLTTNNQELHQHSGRTF